MKKTFTVKDREIVIIECTFTMDSEEISGVYVHERNDVNRDGDGVIGNGCEVPETDEDAEFMLMNETLDTDFEVLGTVRFLDGSRPEDYEEL